MRRTLIWVLFVNLFLTSCASVPMATAVPTATSLPTATALQTSTVIPASTPTATSTATPTATPTLPIAEPWGERRIITLDGNWQMVRVKSLDDPLPTSGWEHFQVPGTLDGYNYERAWFQRTFDVLSEWQSHHLILHFGGVKYNSRILVNGQKVGGHFNGYDAFEVEITDAVKWGETNLLQVGVHDWTGVFSDSAPDLQPYADDWEGLRVAPANRILSAIGGLFTYYGIWDSVTLKVVPAVHMDSFFIRPSLRENRLEVDVTFTNAGVSPFAGSLCGRIFPWHGAGRDASGQWILQGQAVATFPDLDVTLEPGRTQTFTLSLENPPLHPWSPHDPQLYILEIGFDQPQADAVQERFGWREFHIENGDFYLNGKKVHLLAASWWPDGNRWTRDQIVAQLQGIRTANVVAFRTHTQPWQEIWYEVADEVGLMMIPEGAIWNDDITYRINDERFWKNYADHLTAMVQTLRNHPSVVMWSLENELTGERINDRTPAAEKHLADLGLLVKQLDPTRPITFESDGDPGGITDVIGLHYPNEYPDHRLWPQDAYWVDKPRDLFSGGGFFWDNQPFLWDHRKPLYIGEYMWEPSDDPSTHTVMVGDESYINHSYYRTLAKAFAWRMQMLAYRHYEVSGHSPWTVIEEGKLDESNPTWVTTRDMYRPLAAFLREYDLRFYSGENVHRTVELFNDTMSDLTEVQFQWTLFDGDRTIAQGGETLSMTSGDHLERSIQLPMPETNEPKTLTFRLTTGVNGEEKFREEYRLEVYPRGLNLAGIPIALYDPQNRLADALRRAGVTFTPIEDLQAWNGQDILVIAPDALLSSAESDSIPVIGAEDDLSSLEAKIRAGGRVLVLEQSWESPPGILPLRLSAQQSTLAFIQSPSHPILSGLSHADLRWWRGDHIVSTSEPLRASEAGIHTLVVTGDASGISHAPLVEIRQGQGVWIVCQLQVATKLEDEPMAQVLLERMLTYLTRYQPPAGKTLYFPGDWEISALKAAAQPLRDWGELQFPDVRLLIIHGDSESLPLERLQAFVEAGGSVPWDRPSAEINSFLNAIHAKVELQPWTGPAMRAEGAFPLLDFLTREDLYWIGKPSKRIQIPSELAPNTNAMFVPEADSIPTEGAIPAVENAELEGQILRRQGREILMATNGSVTWEIELSQNGMYQFVLLAYGTPLAGVYPQAQVMVDDVPIGTLIVASKTPQAYRLFFNGQAGKHPVSVMFMNDEYNPPEDRNLILSAYLVSPAPDPGGVESLTTPAALVNIPVGKGRLILSTIEWDNAGPNSLRGRRYFAGLLTGLDVTYAGGGAPVTIEAESLTPMPNFSYFDASGGTAAMYTDGYIQGPIRVAQTGQYRLEILARGTPVGGIYPILQVELNGRVLGRVSLTGSWEVHDLLIELPVGTFTLRLRFINDAWSSATGEDRNVWIDRMEFERVK